MLPYMKKTIIIETQKDFKVNNSSKYRSKEIKPENLTIIRAAKEQGIKIRQKQWQHPAAYWIFDRVNRKWLNQDNKDVTLFKSELSTRDLMTYDEYLKSIIIVDSIHIPSLKKDHVITIKSHTGGKFTVNEVEYEGEKTFIFKGR